MKKESYIVRVYRRIKGKPEKIIGTVEEVEKQTTESFSNIDELSKIISSPDKKKRAKGAEKGTESKDV